MSDAIIRGPYGVFQYVRMLLSMLAICHIKFVDKGTKVSEVELITRDLHP